MSLPSQFEIKYKTKIGKAHATVETFFVKSKYLVDSPPGTIENRVFIGGNYALMPILREIEKTVGSYGFQPIIAYDFNIPIEKTREYTLRLLYQCKMAIFEGTLGDGQLVEIVRAGSFPEIDMLQVFMAIDEKKEPPKTMSVMVWQVDPPPQGYITLQELKEIVAIFLLRHRRTTEGRHSNNV
jgi:hypothetical protein